jgi:membrane protein required for colicin V production
MGLNALDWAFVGLLLLSSLVGLLRGIFRETMSLVVWAAALFLAGRYAADVAPHLGRWIEAEPLRLWVARLLLFVGVLAIGGIASALISMALHSARLGVPDRLAGMGFGLVRGALLVALTVLLLQVSGLSDEPWWSESKLIPYAAPFAEVLAEVLAEALPEAVEQGLPRSSGVF